MQINNFLENTIKSIIGERICKLECIYRNPFYDRFSISMDFILTAKYYFLWTFCNSEEIVLFGLDLSR